MLNKEEVQHVAELAKLEFNEADLTKMAKKLSNVLGLIEQLKEVDTTNVQETSQVTGLTDVLRSDEVVDWDKKEVAETLKQAPELDEGEIKVKKVL